MIIGLQFTKLSLQKQTRGWEGDDTVLQRCGLHRKSKLFVLHSILDKWSSTCGLHQENNTSSNLTVKGMAQLPYAWLKSEVPKFFSVKSQKLIWMEGLGPQIKTL